jgi:hypothetical protein
VTGLGKQVHGEGMMGLMRAFFGSLGIAVESAAKPLACPAKPLKILGGVLNPVSFSRQFPKSPFFSWALPQYASACGVLLTNPPPI